MRPYEDWTYIDTDEDEYFSLEGLLHDTGEEPVIPAPDEDNSFNPLRA